MRAAQFRVLGERNPRLEHRHGERWARMDRTIPMLSDRQPKAYRSTWICRTAASASCTNGALLDLAAFAESDLSTRRLCIGCGLGFR